MPKLKTNKAASKRYSLTATDVYKIQGFRDGPKIPISRE